jgi:thiamine transport system substrate-binding protein
MVAMNKGRLVLMVIAILAIVIGGTAKETLVVYTYNSFVSWGPAGELKEAFEARYDCNLEFVTAGGGKATLSRLLAERESGGTDADLFMAEVNDVPRIATYDLFLPVTVEGVPNLAFVPQDLLLGQTAELVPYEYGYITLTYDSQVLNEEDLPKRLEDLADPFYKGKLVCEDPRTSSTGFSFLLWTIAHFGEEGYLDFWRSLAPTLLTITQGWSEAWTLLTHDEAPIVVSFSTDTAYGAMYEDSLRYRAFAPGGQGYRTIYGVGIVRETDQPELAKAFIDLLLSKEIQELLPRTEIMFPANETAELPEEYHEHAVIPSYPLMLPIAMVGEKMGFSPSSSTTRSGSS